MADGDDWVQYGTGAARERAVLAQRLGRGDGVAAADEAHPVGLIGHSAAIRPAHRHQVKHPQREFIP